MKRAAILALAIIVCTSAFANTPSTSIRISRAEAKKIVRKAFARDCGTDTNFRCPYALEDRPACPFEAIVLLPLGPNHTYDGRNRPAWIALSASGEVLRVSHDRASVCPVI
jgi:hypothetical protein